MKARRSVARICRRLPGASLLLLIAAGAAADCREESVCVTAIESANRVAFEARNLKHFPVTLTLSITSLSAATDAPQVVTQTLRPLQSREVLELAQDGGGTRGNIEVDFAWTVGDLNAEHDDEHLYALPYAPGAAWRVLQGYSSRFSHRGLEAFAVDFDMPEGSPVHAARSGIVARVVDTHDWGCWYAGCDRYANYIVILHSDGTTGEYYHLEHDGALVEVGDPVRRGQLIGLSGNTGHSTRPHLHFAVYRAAPGGETQSIPVLFETTEGVVKRPRRGAIYLANH